ncbi:hypothetical protein M9458_023679, partial [Cirrhinus mrigala]
TNFDSVDYSEVLEQKGARDEKTSVRSRPSAQVNMLHNPHMITSLRVFGSL